MPRSHAHRELEVQEPNSSSPLVITSSRVHDVNGTLFHRSWTRDHDFTSSMERSISQSATDGVSPHTSLTRHGKTVIGKSKKVAGGGSL